MAVSPQLFVVLLLLSATFGVVVNEFAVECDNEQDGCFQLNEKLVVGLVDGVAVEEHVSFADFFGFGSSDFTRFSVTHDSKDTKETILLQGHVADKNLFAFLSLSRHGIYGFIESPNNTLIISSGPSSSINPAWGYTCWVHALPSTTTTKNKFSLTDHLLPPTDAIIDVSLRAQNKEIVTLTIATDIDSALYRKLGSIAAAESYYYTLIGATSSIYQRDTGGHTLNSVYLNIYTQSTTDPYPNITDACTMLGFMRTEWNHVNPARDTTVLLSGRTGGGCAYLGTACANPSYAYNVNMGIVGYFPVPLVDYHDDNWDVYVLAHELGHNVNAQHTHDYAPPVDYCGLYYENGMDCGPIEGTLMSYCHVCEGGLENIKLAFETVTATAIRDYIARAC